MRSLILAAGLSSAATLGQAQVVAISDPAYNCTYLIENMTTDQRFRGFMIDYTMGIVTGLNIAQQLYEQPILDLTQFENPMLITWTAQVCNENPDFTMAEAVFRVYEVLWRQQQGG